MTRIDTNKIRREGVLLLGEEVYAIVGAGIEVHNELGSGFAEAVYQEAMEIELRRLEIPFESQKVLRIHYKGQLLAKEYIADLVCFGTVIVEIKSQRELKRREECQIINYLKATKLQVGVLMNFGDPGRLDWHRMVC